MWALGCLSQAFDAATLLCKYALVFEEEKNCDYDRNYNASCIAPSKAHCSGYISEANYQYQQQHVFYNPSRGYRLPPPSIPFLTK